MAARPGWAGFGPPAVMLRSANQMSFVAASSVGKWPRVLMILRTRAWTLSSVGRVDDASDLGRKGEEGDDVLPRLAPHLDDRRKAAAPGVDREGLQRLRG